MIHPPRTAEEAQLMRRQLLDAVHLHRNEAKRRLRDLARLEAMCEHLGIRLIREPVRAQGEQTHDDARSLDR